MKILITSEVHGDLNSFLKIINKHQDVDLHLNAGDLQLSEFELNKIKMIAVRGNTDLYSNLELNEIISFNNKKILLTHGHEFNVKYSLDKLVSYAKSLSVDICIFGHTHVPFDRVIDNIHFINPGPIEGLKPSYAIYTDGKVVHYTL